MRPQVAAAPSNPLPKTAAASRERAGALTGPGAIVTGDVRVARVATSGGGLTAHGKVVTGVKSRNGRISVSESEAGSAGIGVVRGVCSCAAAGDAGSSGRTAASGADNAARMAAAISATF